MTGLRPCEIAVDFGTTNTLVYVRGRGIVLAEPSLVAVDSGTREVRAIGLRAQRMLEHEARSTTPVRPLRHGVIADFDLAVEMLRRFSRDACGRRLAHRRTVVVVPCGATTVAKRAIREAGRSARAGDVHLLDEPIAAAIGAGLPIAEAVASFVVNIGGGTTEAALISMGGIVASRSIPVGGEELDQAVVRHLKRERGLVISQDAAEDIKRRIGSAFPGDEDAQIEVSGSDARSAMPTTVLVTSAEIRDALESRVTRIVEAVADALGRTPPELSSDVLERGTMLTGGGALLKGLAERLRRETQIPAHVAEMPTTCVAAGAGAWLEEMGSGRFQAGTEPRTHKGQASLGY